MIFYLLSSCNPVCLNALHCFSFFPAEEKSLLQGFDGERMKANEMNHKMIYLHLSSLVEPCNAADNLLCGANGAGRKTVIDSPELRSASLGKKDSSLLGLRRHDLLITKITIKSFFISIISRFRQLVIMVERRTRGELSRAFNLFFPLFRVRLTLEIKLEQTSD